MSTLLLDTSVIIDMINGKRGRDRYLLDLILQGNTLACCSINVTEVYAGMRPSEELRTTGLLNSLKFYPVRWEIARLAGELNNDHARRGISLATTDVTIAAVAIHNQLPLITDNTKRYPMKELVLYPLPN
jgi:predicted nucleic acid-binding protein